MKLIKADIHIHTCLSPCAEISVTPKRIVEKASAFGFDLIFITDHNCADNALAAMKASQKYKNLKVCPGMEITSREEVHTLALFEMIDDAMNVQKKIHALLPDVFSGKEAEEQLIVNEFNEVEGYCSKSLFSSADISLDELIKLIHLNNGMAIAAHIDRESFSVISQLGFIPDNINYDALEVSVNTSAEQAAVRYKNYKPKYGFITGSDSHFLENFGSIYTEYLAHDNSYREFRNYLHNMQVS